MFPFTADAIAVFAFVLFLAMQGGQPAFLEVIAGRQGGMTFPLSQGVIRLGAATGEGGLQNDVVLAESTQPPRLPFSLLTCRHGALWFAAFLILSINTLA